ncbi:MAG: UDP-glucose 4-epimerase GalE [Rhodospirillaceae bacterium]
MTILITGGAGYIGSHAVLAFQAAGMDVVVLDDLSTGRRAAVPEGVPFVQGSVGDAATVDTVLADHGVTAVVHFAGSIIVPESVANPLLYYANNTANSRVLIERCVAAGIRHFLFSSTAAIYGMPRVVPIPESMAGAPINPYGRSKLMTEMMLRDTHAAHGLVYGALRYFNVAGADPDLRTGQICRQATHLIKVASEVMTGQRDHIDVYGDDYDTPDGTCIRDYIHVSDLAEAHVQVLSHMRANNVPLILNCGYGRGYSVREVLDTVQAVAGRRIDIRPAPRRPGDPPTLVADVAAIRRRLGWKPRHDNLEFIVRTALDWEASQKATRAA